VVYPIKTLMMGRCSRCGRRLYLYEDRYLCKKTGPSLLATSAPGRCSTDALMASTRSRGSREPLLSVVVSP
jgi:hypothetical protein